MSVFGKKLAGKGIYNQRQQNDKSRERYYDGVKLLTNMRGFDERIDQ